MPPDWGGGAPRAAPRRPAREPTQASETPHPAPAGSGPGERPSSPEGVQPGGPHPPRRVGPLRPSRAAERPAEQAADGRRPADRERGQRGARPRGARPVTGAARRGPCPRPGSAGLSRGADFRGGGIGRRSGAGVSRAHLPGARAPGNGAANTARPKGLPPRGREPERGPGRHRSPGRARRFSPARGLGSPRGWRGAWRRVRRGGGGPCKPSDGPSDRPERGPPPGGATGTGLHERAGMSRPGGNHGERVGNGPARASARVLGVFESRAGEQAARGGEPGRPRVPEPLAGVWRGCSNCLTMPGRRGKFSSIVRWLRRSTGPAGRRTA